MLKLTPEFQRSLRAIHENFESLIQEIKVNQSWDDQQKYEWSIPDYSMFQDLLLACIQDKHVR